MDNLHEDQYSFLIIELRCLPGNIQTYLHGRRECEIIMHIVLPSRLLLEQTIPFCVHSFFIYTKLYPGFWTHIMLAATGLFGYLCETLL